MPVLAVRKDHICLADRFFIFHFKYGYPQRQNVASEIRVTK